LGRRLTARGSTRFGRWGLTTSGGKQRGDQDAGAGAKARLCNGVAQFTNAERLWERGKKLGSHPPRGVHRRAHGFYPRDELVLSRQAGGASESVAAPSAWPVAWELYGGALE
jgi:hypothetical protein